MEAVYYRYGNYRRLSESEFIAIVHYCESKEPSSLDTLIRGDTALSKDMRRFIADILTKRLLPKTGRPRDFWQDYNAFILIDDLQLLGNLKLRDNCKKPGAGYLTAQALRLPSSEEAAITSYQNVKKLTKEGSRLSYVDFVIQSMGDDSIGRDS